MKNPIMEKFLVISEMGIGDALTLLPALKTLKSNYQNIKVDMIAPGLFPLRANIKDLVRILDFRNLAIASAHEKLNWLESQNYDGVWNTENEKSVWRQIFSEKKNPQWLSAPPHRTWPLKSVLELRLEHLREFFPDLKNYSQYQLPLTAEQKKNRIEFLSNFPEKQKLVAIQPGAKDSTKVWPAVKFRDLAIRLAQIPDVKILFFLTKQESEIFTPNFLNTHPNIIYITEPLNDLAPKLAACDLFIGNDSGFYHLAYAFGLPVVGIYRSRRNLKIWSYRSPRSQAIYFYLPTFIRKHWKKCISVQRLYNAAKSFLPN